MGPLATRTLTLEDCTALAPRLHRGDAFECLHQGISPVTALAVGRMEGFSQAVERVHTGTPVGAFGYTTEGIIWSLWASLGARESAQVLEMSPMWIGAMVQCAGRSLHNRVAADNKRSLLWLYKTKCFHVSQKPYMVNGALFHDFETLPLHLLDEVNS